MKIHFEPKELDGRCGRISVQTEKGFDERGEFEVTMIFLVEDCTGIVWLIDEKTVIKKGSE